MRARELANTYMLMLRTEVRRWWMNGKMAQNGNGVTSNGTENGSGGKEG